MVLTALVVCSVPSTRCPVSAAVIAIEIVSASRSSPTRITSGSSRIAARTPSAKRRQVRAELALDDLARLAAVDEFDRVLEADDVEPSACVFRWSIIAASVVDLPVPVEPVTRIMPWW